MDSDFDLRAYLRADLERHQQLLGGRRAGFRLWAGALSPRFLPVLLCRLSYWAAARNVPVLGRLFSLINFTLFGIEVSLSCRIGRGLFFPHTQGTVIGAFSIGENAVIYQGVTLGAKGLDFTADESHRPVVGDGVLIGAGAKVLGGVRIGHGASIGANAVVLTSVPDGAIAVGVPASLIFAAGEVR